MAMGRLGPQHVTAAAATLLSSWLSCSPSPLLLLLPHLTSPHLTSPHLSSAHPTSPHPTSPHLTYHALDRYLCYKIFMKNWTISVVNDMLPPDSFINMQARSVVSAVA